MTYWELDKLVEEFGLKKDQILNRLYYTDRTIGNYYYNFASDNPVVKIEFWQSKVSTLYYKSARNEIMRQIERVKKEKLENKLKQIKEDF